MSVLTNQAVFVGALDAQPGKWFLDYELTSVVFPDWPEEDLRNAVLEVRKMGADLAGDGARDLPIRIKRRKAKDYWGGTHEYKSLRD